MVNLLQEVSSLANQSRDPTRATQEILAQVGNALSASYARAHFFDESMQKIEWQAPQSTIEHIFEQVIASPHWIEEGPPAQARKERSVVAISDYSAEQITIAVLAVPVLVANEVVAVLEWYGWKKEEDSQKLIEELPRVSGQLACVIERKIAEERQRKLQLQLIDTSHQVGMAEVATGALHNIGNVLNSVNVSVNMVANRVRQSKLTHIQKVSELLRKEQDNLAQFFSQGEKGKHLVTYVTKTSEQLRDEQTNILGEVDTLAKNVEYIKEIIAQQQENAKRLSVIEEVRMNELIDNAISLQRGSFRNHQVEVVYELEEIPPLQLERQKLLQILVNLLSNAKHAVCDSGFEHKQITIRTGYVTDAQPFIEIEDNGIGISPENLTKIFFYGFTTKKHGHGFGLHSCALIAKSIGTTLLAFSDGPGKGARFRIVFDSALKNTTRSDNFSESGRTHA